MGYIISLFMDGFQILFEFNFYPLILGCCMIMALLICIIEWCFKVV